jgi:hypothetical protein
MKEVQIIFKASGKMAEFLKKQAKERKTTKSELIRACVSKQLNYTEKVI